jgi:16S rRNA (guanine(966)-N(2))-methyltransferase RsmD
VRPTADRVKEAIFNILGAPPPGARALDLYAGSGALGLEALSRGCSESVFVERAGEALDALRHNIEELGVGTRARVMRGEALATAGRLSRAGERFTWIFLDPPYQSRELPSALEASGELCEGGATVVAEHDKRSEPAERVGALARRDQRRYGDTCVSFYERAWE